MLRVIKRGVTITNIHGSAKNNFVFNSTCIWNGLIDDILNKCTPNGCGIVVPGSAKDSDLTISVGVAKNKLKNILLNTQKVDPLKDLLGWSESQDWYPENFLETHYPVYTSRKSFLRDPA